MSGTIKFEKAALCHKSAIFGWLDEPHVKEFWDNSLEHRVDIVSYMEGRKQKSRYFDGIFSYFVGSVDGEPFCLVMTSEVGSGEDVPKEWLAHLSNTGKTSSIDFMIGNTKYLGKGLAATTLLEFTDFFSRHIDRSVDTYIIDPSKANVRARHVYEKAGFTAVAEFVPEDGFFENIAHVLMVKKMDKDLSRLVLV